MDLERLKGILREHGVHDVEGSEAEVLSAVIEEVLGSTADIAAFAGMNASHVHRLLRKLEKRRLIASTGVSDGSVRDERTVVKLGATRQRVPRWHLDGNWPERLESSWHSRAGLGCLLERQPLVDLVYPAAADIARDLGRIRRFKWYRGWPWDAVADYENGWVMFLWSGVLEREDHLYQRMSRIALRGIPELQMFGHDEWPAVRGMPARPSFISFFVPDHLQGDLVFRVAREIGWEDWIQVRCWADGSVVGPENVLSSRGWLNVPVLYVDDGGWTLDQRLDTSLWTQEDSITVFRLLQAVAEWRDMTAEFGRQYCVAAGDPYRVKAALQKLYEAGLVSRRMDGNRYRYRITTKGLNGLSRIDWIYGKAVHADFKGDSMNDSTRNHEHGLQSAVGPFYEKALPVAVGFRRSERFKGGGIDPDAMIWLNHSPLGPGWHCLEYELSARGPSGAKRKFGRYLSPDRPEDLKLLAVLRGDRMERHLQELARDAGVPVITTTVQRLKRYSPVGDPRCWSLFGEPVILG